MKYAYFVKATVTRKDGTEVGYRIIKEYDQPLNQKMLSDLHYELFSAVEAGKSKGVEFHSINPVSWPSMEK